MTSSDAAVQAERRSISSDDSIVDASVEFQDWYEVHEALGCTLNHSGSSPAVEVEGALVLWRRLIARRNLRYINVVSDGDSKTISALNKEKPYGDDVEIVKFECVGHVQKRVGASIIKLTKTPPHEEVHVEVSKAIYTRP